jgi:type IV pilus assembly protein PilF
MPCFSQVDRLLSGANLLFVVPLKKFFLILVCPFFVSCSTTQKNKELASRHLDVANSLYTTGKYPQALRELLNAKKLDPKNPSILNSIGLTYQARGRGDLAIKFLKESLDISPNYTEARNNLVRIYIENRRFNEAEKELKIVKADLTFGAIDIVYLNEGLLYFDQKKFDLALEPFAKSIQFSRGSCSPHQFYGRTLFELKRYGEAASALDRAINFCQNSGNDEPHYFSALSYYRSGDKRKAAIRFDEIVKLYPNGNYLERSKSLLELVKKEL